MEPQQENPTKQRLQEIDKELDELYKIRDNLKSKWESEKKIIQKIRTLKSQSEELKQKAEEYERNGELGKVAEIRYGLLIDIEKKLKNSNDKLVSLQSDGKMLKEVVGAEDIAEIVAKWTGIPVNKMLETERTKLLNIEERIHQRLVNQEDAVSAVANAIRRSRSGLQDAKRPIGSFIFLGSTGVGKTEMARALAEFLFDDENSLVRIDMSEYMEKFSVSRLLGAPPGYIGYEEGGQLTEAIRRRPYSVILLDEIEKAHSDVFNVLLQVLDDGRLTDGKGRTVNFRNTRIIMTSNLGTELIQDKISEINDDNRNQIMYSIRQSIFNILKSRMRPEFLNRIDEILLFKPLTGKEIAKIAEFQLNNLRIKLELLGYKLEITPEAIEWLTKLGYDINYGARPLKRALQKYVSDPLAIKLLSSEYSIGEVILIDAGQDGAFIFKKG